VFPRKIVPGRKERVNHELFAANGTAIPTYGWISLSLNLELLYDFTWRFVVADVQSPIIGVDLLAHFGLVDSWNNRLLDGITSLSAPARTAHMPVPRVKTTVGGALVDNLVAEFPELVRRSGIPRDVRHNTVHHMSTTPGPPVTCRPRRLEPDRLAIAKAQFDAMLRDGTARHSECSWSSALYLVAKDNG
jgi:hypothetical protein